MPRIKTSTIHPVDTHVGARMRLRRSALGLSQEQLGTSIGLTFQQIQKYERGTNRMGASRLFEVSNVLDVPVSYFFDNMPEELQKAGPTPSNETMPDAGILTEDQTIQLVKAYFSIPDPATRNAIFQLAKAMAKSGL